MKQWLSTLLAVAAIGAAQTPAGSPGGEIGGTVRSAKTGGLLKSVQVTLRRLSDPRPSERSATTGVAGDFLFANLAAGEYSLEFHKAGYRTVRSSNTRLLADALPRITDLDIKLVPTGAISGIVLDAHGEPAPNAQVRAYSLAYRGGRPGLLYGGRAEADDQGLYRIHGLHGGKYIISVWPPPEGTPAGEFYAGTAGSYYPNVSGPSEAAPVNVDWGQEATDINLVLSNRPAYSVLGAAFDATTGAPCLQCSIGVVQLDGPFSVTLPGSLHVSPRGLFVFRGLGAGSYKIIAKQDGPSEHVAQRQVQIRDRPAEDMVLAVSPGQTISGAIVFDNPQQAADATGITVSLSSLVLPQSWPSRDADVRSDLSFRIERVPAETYRVELNSLLPGAYLKTLRLQGRDLPRPDLAVPEGGPLSGVEAVITFDGATVTGQVKPSGSVREVDARVALIPKPDQGGYLQERFTQTAAGGRFHFAGVPPGEYSLFALPARAAVEIADPTVQQGLRAYGRDVSLEPKANLSVDLALAPDPAEPAHW